MSEARIVSEGRFKGRTVFDHAFDGLGEFHRYLVANEARIRPLADTRVLNQEGHSWEHMLATTNVNVNTAPLRMFVEASGIGSMAADTMQQRGVLVSALVDLLAQVRPVEVWACVTTDANERRDAHVNRIKLSAPFSLAELALLLGDTNLTRQVRYAMAIAEDRACRGVSWGFGSYDPDPHKTGDSIAMATIAEPQDVFFPGVTNVQTWRDAMADPSTWLQTRLDQVMAGVEAGVML